MSEEELKGYFQQVEDAFHQAVISNNVENIKTHITLDWVLVETRAGIIPQERFFQVVKQGLLSHSTMTKEILRVKVYDNIALVTGRGKNVATWQGQHIEADEW
jgi:hypothetical protein